MTDYKHLTVKPEIADEVRASSGRNDTERLKNWANKNTEETLNELLDGRDLEQKLEEMIEDKIRELNKRWQLND